MLDGIVLWLLQLVVSSMDAMRYVALVQKIRLFYGTSVPLAASATHSGRLHLAVCLNPHGALNPARLRQLINHVQLHYQVTHLTLLSGSEDVPSIYTCAKDSKWDNVEFYENYEPFGPPSETKPKLSVNMVSEDSLMLYCAFLSETVSLGDCPDDASAAALRVIESFCTFPAIDLYLCMNRDFAFIQLYPLQLQFTHF